MIFFGRNVIFQKNSMNICFTFFASFSSSSQVHEESSCSDDLPKERSLGDLEGDDGAV